MNLKDKISKLGHYAHKGLRSAIKPLTIGLAGLSLIASTYSQAKAQNEADTVYGTGIFTTFNEENDNRVKDVLLSLTPENMAMITPDTSYQFITDIDGGAEFELPVYIDSTVNIDNLISSKSKVLPNFGSEINAFFPEVQEGVIELYNMAGQLVKRKEFHSDKEYVPLSNLKEGMYVYSVRTTDGVKLGGKFLKQNTPLQGPASHPPKQSFSHKDVEFYEATYWAKWEHPDFFTDSTLITLEEGNNGFINFFMTSNIPPPPDNIDLEGQVWKLENLNQTLENAQIHVNVLGSSQEFNTTSDENGYFRIDNVPLGKDILFSVGGISERYSFTNVEYTTPSEIVNLSDSVNSNFGAVLPLKLSTSSADHIHDQTLNGTQQDTIWFYLGNSYTINQKNTIRNYFTNFQADENNAYIFEESFTELNNIGINIEYGTYNTQAYSTEITTPLGNTLHPVIYANTTMGVGNYITFVHEIKRALAIGEVAWYSVMKATAPDYTQEDKDIAKDVLRPYWNKAVYQEEKTWIDLIKISEDMNSKSPNSNSSTTKVDTYEPSSSQDDIKFNYINK